MPWLASIHLFIFPCHTSNFGKYVVAIYTPPTIFDLRLREVGPDHKGSGWGDFQLNDTGNSASGLPGRVVGDVRACCNDARSINRIDKSPRQAGQPLGIFQCGAIFSHRSGLLQRSLARRTQLQAFEPVPRTALAPRI